MKFILIRKRVLMSIALTVLALAIALASVGMTASAGVFLGKTTRKLPIYSVETDQKLVALTFDASWGATKTPLILEAATKYDIPITYFVVGFWAQKQQAELKMLVDSGRVEIGTHSNNHPDMAKLKQSQIELELTASISIIEGITNKKVTLFRPPFGSYNDTLLTTAEKLGLYTIQWDVDSLDWQDKKAGDMAAKILKKTRNGSIILMHNDGKYTVEALPLIIEGLKNKGYTFTTVGDLIYKDGFTIDHEGRQTRR